MPMDGLPASPGVMPPVPNQAALAVARLADVVRMSRKPATFAEAGGEEPNAGLRVRRSASSRAVVLWLSVLPASRQAAGGCARLS
jgi:hypothetical protein